MRRLTLAALAILLAAPAFAADPLLNPVFQDHAVLQREQPIHVWGTAALGSTVTVALAGKSAQGRAVESGKWEVVLPAMAAGGPYALTATDDKGGTQTVADLLVGDVYLCSGQSNMAFVVRDAIDAGPDIQVSANDSIRLFTVANVTNLTPLSALPSPGKWAAAGPATVPSFSAACYYFARELQKSIHVPLGLINSSWGGANITSFMSADAVTRAGKDQVRLDALKLYANEPAAGMKHWGELTEAWWGQHIGSALWKDPSASANWPLAPKGLGIWSEWNVPALAHYSGHMWYRTSVTLTAAQAAQEAQLSLGTVTEEDQTWVNGRFIGSTFAYGQPRTYALAPGVLHEGVNDLLINDYCGWRGCGLFGPAEARAIRFKDGTAVPLDGWRYQPVPASVGTSPRVPWGATAGITVAYNAMIAPLGNYGLKGVLWYQGESNTGDPEGYRTLLKAWMADWRSQFQAPALPFLIVQLPDYGLPPFAPEDSSWARLRESQRLAVADDANAALAVTIDIGDHMGLHPGAKQEVGRRLSLTARRLIYRDAGVKTGPMPAAVTKGKGVVTVTFTGVDGKLAAVNAVQPIGFELCAANVCRFTPAAINGNSVRLLVPRGLAPTHVRYCWADGPVCTLYDAARIPAVPFDIPIQTAPAKRRGHRHA